MQQVALKSVSELPAVTSPGQEFSEHVCHSLENRSFHENSQSHISENRKHVKNSTNNGCSERERESCTVDVARERAAVASTKESDAGESEKEPPHGSISSKFKVANENIDKLNQPEQKVTFSSSPKATNESDIMFRDHESED